MTVFEKSRFLDKNDPKTREPREDKNRSLLVTWLNFFRLPTPQKQGSRVGEVTIPENDAKNKKITISLHLLHTFQALFHRTLGARGPESLANYRSNSTSRVCI